MGRRSAGESIVAILAAFIEQRTWTQASLAERVEITVPQLRKRLDELSRIIELHDEHEHPHVYWSVPKTWFPGGVTIPSADAEEVLRQLARAPQSEERDRLLLALAVAAGKSPPEAVASVPHLPDDEDHLRAVEDAWRDHAVLAMRYFSAGRGDLQDRLVSVQRILLGTCTRFVGHCHRSGELRFFRLSRLQSARLDRSAAFVAATEEAVDAFIGTSVSGYREPGTPVAVAFTVRESEARWVRDTLPLAMEAEPIPGGTRFHAETAGVLALARFVVGLGDAARVETAELREAVHELASGALAGSSPSIRSVAAIRSSELAGEAG